MSKKETKTNKNYIFAVGRRKESVARVRLFHGKGENTVNGMPFAKYFPGSVNEYLFSLPFKIVDVWDKYYVTVKVSGGGKKGQIGAVAHGIARALLKSKEEFKKALRDAGLLTRDARVKERRKVGTGGKARRKKQSPKR
ncbi:MAG: 30S ribosomal protein S9 [Patescibacteria group bacterium]|nr:30S ribosomal protein S9 [Patescibacteria group bacterium]MCX7928579.1 30S ribosomal protein S9 [Patescibacteria group bacterium]